jgi:hypothetical protein
MTWRVGVVVPARDEEARIGACLEAVAAAVRRAGRPAIVCVVADRCRDATAALARAAGVDVVFNDGPLTIGDVRNLGVRRVASLLGDVTERTWLLGTDADTVVPPTWIVDHLRYAETGAAAVAGAVDLDDPHLLPVDTLARYTRLVAARVAGRTHGHAYAANLGVRADAFLQVGGYPGVVCGEEHALLARLRHAGHLVLCPTDVRARTSARTAGRARGGLADLLCALA